MVQFFQGNVQPKKIKRVKRSTMSRQGDRNIAINGFLGGESISHIRLVPKQPQGRRTQLDHIEQSKAKSKKFTNANKSALIMRNSSDKPSTKSVPKLGKVLKLLSKLPNQGGGGFNLFPTAFD